MVFVIAVGITPVRGRIQTFVDKRFKDPASLDRRLSAFAAEVRFVSEVLDRRRLAARFLTEVVEASGSPGGMFELPGADPIVAGQWEGEPGVAITLRGRAGMVGRLLLAQRADGSDFTPSEREQLQRTADVIAEAM